MSTAAISHNGAAASGYAAIPQGGETGLPTIVEKILYPEVPTQESSSDQLRRKAIQYIDGLPEKSDIFKEPTILDADRTMQLVLLLGIITNNPPASKIPWKDVQNMANFLVANGFYIRTSNENRDAILDSREIFIWPGWIESNRPTILYQRVAEETAEIQREYSTSLQALAEDNRMDVPVQMMLRNSAHAKKTYNTNQLQAKVRIIPLKGIAFPNWQNAICDFLCHTVSFTL